MALFCCRKAKEKQSKLALRRLRTHRRTKSERVSEPQGELLLFRVGYIAADVSSPLFLFPKLL